MNELRALPPDVRPQMMAGYLRRILENEMRKGSEKAISRVPVELEPPYRWFNSSQELLDAREHPPFLEATYLPDPSDLTRLTAWVNSAHECNWTYAEGFIRELSTLRHRLVFEVSGNQKAVHINFLCHKEDEIVLKTVFYAVFPCCELAPVSEHPLSAFPLEAWADFVFRQFNTPGPYSELLTRSNQLPNPPVRDFVSALRFVVPPSRAVYQVVMQPVDPSHDWHRNVGLLIDVIYYYKLCMGYGVQQRMPQQMPTGQLSNKASDVETKSNTDRPFFAVDVRIGLLGYSDGIATELLRGLTVPMNLFLHGGRPLESLSHDDYAQYLQPAQVRDMFLLGRTYRSGSLLNSSESSGLLHLPALAEFEQQGIEVHTVDTLPTKGDIFSGGIRIGRTVRTAQPRDVFIPHNMESSHVHIIGRPRMGKSYLLNQICLEAASGHGLAILDPHDDLAEMFMGCLREEWLDRVVFLDFGDPYHIPIWNPLAQREGVRPSRITDDFLGAFARVTTGWGDRLETLLRQAFYGLIQTGCGTVADAATLFTRQAKERDTIRRRILDAVSNTRAREFWTHEFPHYREEQVMPVMHKLTKLLLDDTLDLVLSQPINRVDFREIMDKGMLLVVKLSGLGPGRGDLLGSLILSLLHLTALTRSEIPPEERRPFTVCADEGHRFVTDSTEHMIAETRKYNVSLLIAHQSLGQFEKDQVDALGMVGTTIAFNVMANDASHMAKLLGPDVDPKDLTRLDEREALVRIHTDLVRITTPWMDTPPNEALRQRAKELSWQRYCRPASELREECEKRHRAPARPFIAVRARGSGSDTPEEYVYDEF